MYFSNSFYVSDLIRERVWKVKWRLKHKKNAFGTYVITLSQDDQLEFYQCEYLYQAYYKKNPPCIVGVAIGWYDACDLIIRIVSDVAKAQGDYDIKKYFHTDITKRKKLKGDKL